MLPVGPGPNLFRFPSLPLLNLASVPGLKKIRAHGFDLAVEELKLQTLKDRCTGYSPRSELSAKRRIGLGYWNAFGIPL
jgi:hypothetical protein